MTAALRQQAPAMAQAPTGRTAIPHVHIPMMGSAMSPPIAHLAPIPMTATLLNRHRALPLDPAVLAGVIHASMQTMASAMSPRTVRSAQTPTIAVRALRARVRPQVLRPQVPAARATIRVPGLTTAFAMRVACAGREPIVQIAVVLTQNLPVPWVVKVLKW